MIDWLKETEMATRLESAIARVIEEGKVRIYNMSVKACPPWWAATRTRPTTAGELW
jgi:hypothetical protein